MMNKEEYKKHVSKTCPKTKEWRTMLLAFIVGGTICMIGEGFRDLYTEVIPKFNSTQVTSLVTITMIFFGSLFTGLGLYDKLGRYAGAGSVIPITGFANSVVSPAVEFNREGLFYGVMSNMFVVAGPIIVSGVVWSVLVGLIYFIVGVAV